MKHTDPDELKIPAYLRNKKIVHQSRQRLILTALDRKEAGLAHNSKKALATIKKEYLPRVEKVEQIVKPTEEVLKIPDFSNSLKAKKLQPVGIVTHFISHLNVVLVKLGAPLKQGDIILYECGKNLFLESIQEMQIDKEAVTKAKTGSHVGIKVSNCANIDGKIYKLVG